ncbi:MAG: glycosyltransferase 87 family protein, partial [Corynebacterium variabile]
MKRASSGALVPWLIFGVLAVASGVHALVTYVVNSGGIPYHIDFDVYREGGRAVLDDISLYEGVFSVGTITLPFTYPPLSALAFVPLAVLPLNVGQILFTLVSVATLVLTVVIVLAALAREAGRGLSRGTLWALGTGTALLATWMWPVASTLEFGQINVLLMLLVVADLLLPKTPWPRGTLIGLAAALKLTPAVFGLYFLLRRQWREAATSLISGIAFSALAWAFLPGDSHRYWTETVSDPTRIGGLMYSANQSWRGMVARFTG